MHFFAPANLSPLPKNIVFVIDVSGSMWGVKMKQVCDVTIDKLTGVNLCPIRVVHLSSLTTGRACLPNATLPSCGYSVKLHLNYSNLIYDFIALSCSITLSLSQTVEAMQTILDDLTMDDYFSIVDFNHNVRCWSEELVPGSTIQVAEAKKYIQNIKPNGGERRTEREGRDERKRVTEKERDVEEYKEVEGWVELSNWERQRKEEERKEW